MEIYLITNNITGDQYVGQTKYTKEVRWKSHLSGNLYIDRAIRKYGQENFSLKTLEFVEKESDLDDREIFWIDKLKTLTPDGYNILPGGQMRVGASVGDGEDIEKMLRRMFYPANNLNMPKPIKVCVCSRKDISDAVSELINFDELTPFEKGHFVNTHSLERDFAVMLGREKIESLSKSIKYYPSKSALSNYPPEEYMRWKLSLWEINDSITNQKLIQCEDKWNLGIYEDRDDSLLLYVFESNLDEYNQFAEKEIDRLCKKLQVDTSGLYDFMRKKRQRIKMIAEKESKKQQLKQEEYFKLVEKWIRSVVKRCTITKRKDKTFIVSISVNNFKFKSSNCYNKFDALSECKDWLIKTLGLPDDTVDHFATEQKELELKRKQELKNQEKEKNRLKREKEKQKIKDKKREQEEKLKAQVKENKLKNKIYRQHQEEQSKIKNKEKNQLLKQQQKEKIKKSKIGRPMGRTK